MAFAAAGTNVPTRIVFNSGALDFGSQRIVQLDDLNFGVEYTTVLLYVLGSIKGQDNIRHSEKVSLSAKIKSFSPEMDAIAFGSSSAGTPNVFSVTDGQPTLANPILTIIDRNNNKIQYQLTNAIFKSSKVHTKAEDFAEFSFELEATDITLLYTT